MSHWFVYMIRCSDDSLYTGMTKDVQRRVEEHKHSNFLGAKYTRMRRPICLVFCESLETRSQAAKRERKIKRLTRKGKEALIKKIAPVLS